jgi:hypothetical protein
MASGIYAILHVGYLKLYVCDTSNIHAKWLPILEQLNCGTYPHTMLQKVWNQLGGKRHFTFHVYQEIAGDQQIINIEQLALDRVERTP